MSREDDDIEMLALRKSKQYQSLKKQQESKASEILAKLELHRKETEIISNQESEKQISQQNTKKRKLSLSPTNNNNNSPEDKPVIVSQSEINKYQPEYLSLINVCIFIEYSLIYFILTLKKYKIYIGIRIKIKKKK